MKVKKYLIKEKVDELLLKNGMKRSDLSQRIDVYPSYFSNLLNGSRPISNRTLQKFCDILHAKEKEIAIDYRSGKYTRVNDAVWNQSYFQQMLSKKQLSVYALSKKINKSISLFSAYQRRGVRPSLEILYDICNVLDCDAEQLIGISVETLNKYNPKLQFKKKEDENFPNPIKEEASYEESTKETAIAEQQKDSLDEFNR